MSFSPWCILIHHGHFALQKSVPAIQGLQSMLFTSLKTYLNMPGSSNIRVCGLLFLRSNTEFLRSASNQPGTHAEDRSFFHPFAVAFQIFLWGPNRLSYVVVLLFFFCFTLYCFLFQTCTTLQKLGCGLNCYHLTYSYKLSSTQGIRKKILHMLSQWWFQGSQ